MTRWKVPGGDGQAVIEAQVRHHDSRVGIAAVTLYFIICYNPGQTMRGALPLSHPAICWRNHQLQPDTVYMVFIYELYTIHFTAEHLFQDDVCCYILFSNISVNERMIFPPSPAQSLMIMPLYNLYITVFARVAPLKNSRESV